MYSFFKFIVKDVEGYTLIIDFFKDSLSIKFEKIISQD